MAITSCRHFLGDRPCGKSSLCEDSCPAKSIPNIYVLVIHLGAIGAVVRATSLLKAIKRKYPGSHLTWVTDAPSDQLLKNHPLIDRVLTTKSEDLLCLSVLEFEIAFVVDKSLKAAGVLRQTQVEKVFGFQASAQGGGILPATAEAEELWQLGLDNHRKFFVNTKPETQLMIEALELGPYRREEYDLPLTESETRAVEKRRRKWREGHSLILGINTGCSSVIPYKKLSVEFHRQLIQKIHQEFPDIRIVLLGGPEDRDRNEKIGRDLPVHQSPTLNGLRDGFLSVAACDVVLTGDSLGMHMAIALKKYVVAWFGPTCAHEIDLYGRGEKILSKAPCAPCWKRVCDQPTMCYDLVPIHDVMEALKRGFNQCLSMSSSKPPSLEICS